jgi:hypothetical protein
MIEYTHRLEFDVLTTPLAEIDRRALSQAWYSALRLGHESSQPSPAAARPITTPALARTSTNPSAFREPRATAANARVSRTARGREPVAASAERRAPRSELARRIERIAARPLAPARGAFFVLRGKHGRVQIMVRSQAGRTHLVAVCAPEARLDVARALDEVRYTLARVREVVR